MKKMTMSVLAAWAVLCGQEVTAVGQEKAVRNPRLVEKEIALAKSAGLYAVVDLGLKSVEIKARGMTLKRWEVIRSRVWGRAVEPRVAKILKRSTLFPPKRTNITPKPGEESEDVELGVLELSRMPTHFSVRFEENIKLKVRPRTRNILRWLRNVGSSAVWYGFLPLKTIWGSVSRKPFTEIEIVTESEKDARALYWSFYENLNVLISR